MQVLVTGSSGLIGSEAVRFYDKEHTVVGVDNNMRKFFFGEKGDTSWNLQVLKNQTSNFIHRSLDIANKEEIFRLFQEFKFDLIIHCAAQPSHDKAAEIPFEDFQTNAWGTLVLLEATRQFAPESPFLFMSTNKVYGDAPNEIPLKELEKRWEYERPEDYNGVSESCRIDQCLHSLFGASKTSADVVAQEYGRYFGLNVGIFRGGCLTGPSHSGVELHGFLNYLVKVGVSGGKYRIFGYKGKQVRDNLHSYDVITAFEAFRNDPRPGEVYNLGGGRGNSISMLEAIDSIEELCGKKFDYEYVDQARRGDHICYISDLAKLKSHFPGWDVSINLHTMLKEMVKAEEERLASL